MTSERSKRRKISLHGCWTKIQRAKEHRDALDEYIGKTLSVYANCPTVGIKFDKKTSEHILYVSRMPDYRPFLRKIGVLLGDIFHNLRSSLDHLAWQLAWWHTHGNIRHPKKVQFPIADTPTLFAQEERTHLGEVHPKHRTIIERFQPYRRRNANLFTPVRNHPLVLLRDFSNMDKHQMLTPVVMPTKNIKGASGLAASLFLAGGIGGATVKAGFIELGTELVRGKVQERIFHPDVKVAAHIIPEVSLSQWEPVILTLDKIAAMTVNVIREFKPFS